MIRTLYIRIVVFFILSVIVGLVCAFFSTILIYKDRLDNWSKTDIREQAELNIDLIRMVGMEEVENYPSVLTRKGQFRFVVFDADGKLIKSISNATRREIEKDRESIVPLLHGQQYGDLHHGGATGVSFDLEGQRYVMFLHRANEVDSSFINYIVLTALVIALVVGSLCAVVWAHYLVKPLKEMKRAVDRISRGQFNIEFNWKKGRKDELGDLAQSFATMAGELREIEEMRQNFVSNVSHEIQSPLTSISGFSNVLLKKNLSENERSRYLGIIKEESERLSRLSDNLLKLASLDSEHHPFNPRFFDLDEQIRRIVLACEPLWSEKSLEIDLDLPSVKIWADEDLLSMVWINVIGNAIKFTPEGGWITISARKELHSIEVTITDNGTGIPEEARQRVFERFYKVDAAREKKLAGNGLGLAIVHKIVTVHRGHISIGGGPGGGTVVSISFPATKY
ncbi:signal transduction histidine kinase [Paenibacillus cellulosilyticus]|uniref:Heme sensor protein HssS n=1 Tax=Paenibacillus cellulosilyticus TaxID=375489 RepID=A0A2V2Z4N9_9BACL|nr:HAMP domain-containing sensor histidine kinase [Paenibacillus cellulosilyticus]PWW08760.1 signal transduction histidine kinase [Paenibacillus cellulosilyticus]QKS48316.1 HAMP domain-containing protein [Paenibacillus cellulosilyticus]